MGARGPRAVESALGLRVFSKFPWLKVPIYNLVYNLLYDPVRDPVCDLVKGGWAVWR